MTDSGDWSLSRGREFDLVRRIAEAAGGGEAESVLVGIGDDAAVVRGEGNLVISTDLSVEGIHFRVSWLSPAEVGYRATAAALSDLAAMSAEPVGVLLSLAIDRARANVWATGVAEGVGEALRYAGGTLLGGDVSRVPDGAPMVIDVVAVGRAAKGITRAGALPGHEIWVTGALGWPACAVAAWEGGEEPPQLARQRFAHPHPRIREAQWIAGRAGVSAMIDLSDGLVADLGHIAAASRVGLTVRAELLPIPTELVKAKGLKEARTLALSGGEEYELCFTVPPGEVESLVEEFASRFDLQLTHVGDVTEGGDVNIVGAGVDEIRPGHDHFRDNSPA